MRSLVSVKGSKPACINNVHQQKNDAKMHKELKKLNIFSTKETFEASLQKKPSSFVRLKILSVFFFLIFLAKNAIRAKVEKAIY